MREKRIICRDDILDMLQAYSRTRNLKFENEKVGTVCILMSSHEQAKLTAFFFFLKESDS